MVNIPVFTYQKGVCLEWKKEKCRFLMRRRRWPQEESSLRRKNCREYDYIRAEKLTRKLLDLGLITIEGFDKIMALNRESFSPALARIMPRNACYRGDLTVTCHIPERKVSG